MTGNGRVTTLIRIAASTVIGMTALVAGAYLLSLGVDVPAPWWAIATLAVAGVTGADVVSAIVRAKQGGIDNDTRA
jgi:divalent metal cation (Fe/Co/Zn/Cd) transporter